MSDSTQRRRWHAPWLVLLLATQLSAQQPPLPGAPTFAASCSGCHGADGRGGEHAPNIATTPEVQRLADRDLAAIIHNGIAGAGMPAFSTFRPEQIADLVAYLRTLQGRSHVANLPGDAGHGERLFYGKAQCSECHMVNGKGGFYGGDLSFYGANASPEQLRALLIDPATHLPQDKKETSVVTQSGQTLTGMLKTSSNFSVALQTEDGQYHFLTRSEIRRIDIGSHSPMQPASLTPVEMDDLLSYLLRAGEENASRTPSHAKADDDEN